MSFMLLALNFTIFRLCDFLKTSVKHCTEKLEYTIILKIFSVIQCHCVALVYKKSWYSFCVAFAYHIILRYNERLYHPERVILCAVCFISVQRYCLFNDVC